MAVEMLFHDLVSKPELKSRFVLPEELAVVSNEREHPVDHGTIAFDEN